MLPARTSPPGDLPAQSGRDPHRLTVRTQLSLGLYESAVYLVRDHRDTFVRESYTLTFANELIPFEGRASTIPGLSVASVKSAYCAGPGGKYELSMAEHAALMWSGEFARAMQQIAKGLFPEEVIQRTIGARVRLKVNEET